MSSRKLIAATVLLAACSAPTRVVVTPPSVPARKPDLMMPALSRALEFREAVLEQRVKDAAALIKVADAVNAQVRAARGAPHRPPATSSASHAGHSNAWWIGVSICEQGGRNDPYFGYFSYMDGSEGGGKSWAEQVARGNQTIAQYGDHAWAASCVAAGYAASPGG